MSHVVAIKTEIKNLDALERACAELGLTLHRHKQTIRWYGRWMNDYSREDAAYKLGIKPEQYGTCDHAISVPGCNYDIGLIQNPETGGYKIYFDFWGQGKKIQAKLGDGGERLLDYYGVNVAEMEADKLGLFSERITIPGTQKLQLKISGM